MDEFGKAPVFQRVNCNWLEPIPIYPLDSVLSNGRDKVNHFEQPGPLQQSKICCCLFVYFDLRHYIVCDFLFTFSFLDLLSGWNSRSVGGRQRREDNGHYY